MIVAPAIRGRPPDDPILDWNLLVAEGRRSLEAMSDGRWTDFNAHDPGITILELVCYALTDLGYRAQHSVSDLLAGFPALAGPAELLTTRAVTLADLRRTALDADGVRNVWIEPAESPALRLRHAPVERKLEFDPGVETIGSEPVRLRGVHRVLIEKSSDQDLPSDEVARAVALRMHANRNLGEDFDEFAVLKPQPVAVDAEVEIEDSSRADAILLDILDRLERYMSPRADRRSVAALRDLGRAAETIFDGPVLERGAVENMAELAVRRRALHLSDVLAELSRVSGVRATRGVRLRDAADASAGAAMHWSLPVGADRAPSFDPRLSRIRLFAGGALALDSASREDLTKRFGERLRAQAEVGSSASDGGAAPTGRDRRVKDYRPLRLDLPGVYGVRPGSLGPNTAPERRAQANQLRGYLAIFDALLANTFAQLAAAPGLLGGGDGRPPQTYWAQMAEAEGADEARLLASDFSPDALQSMVEEPGGAEAVGRRNRFLGHLLARLGESAPAVPPPGDLGFGSASGEGAAPEDNGGAAAILAIRERFLSRFPMLSAGRGTGVDLLSGAREPPLAERIRLKLGLSAAAGERLLLVEHVLLRAIGDDQVQAHPILEQAARDDPYSLQISVVLDDRLRPLADDLRRVVREETPAHLVVYLRWLAPAAFDAFAAAYGQWLDALRRRRREQLGLGEETVP